MSSLNGGLIMIEQMLPNLPKSERAVAEYILQNAETAITLTSYQLGAKSSTSSSAVIRLCKSLNLNGLQELKLRITGDILKDEVVGYNDIKPNETIKSVIQKTINNSIQAIKETEKLLNVKNIEKAINFLQCARRIHFVGLGASSIIAQDAKQKFTRINKNVYASSDMHLAATLVANSNETDVVVGISFSGETREVAKILQMAKHNGVKTISITKYGNSEVAEYADIKLFTSASFESTFRSGATSSRISQLQVIDILFMGVASLNYEHTIESLEATRKAVKFLS